MIEQDIKLDFSDVLICPRMTNINSRSEVNPERTIHFGKNKGSWTGVPIIISNMDTVGTIEMAKVAEKYKMITCLHKYYTSHHIESIKKLDNNYYAISTGIGENDIKRMNHLLENIDCRFICIDIANGYTPNFRNVCKMVREKYPNKIIMAGNIVTKEYIPILNDLGIDIIKMGIGSGSVCTTRIQTGVGYPQLSAILESKDTIKELGLRLISDGGIQNPGDVAKALCAGADFVMLGGLFSGHTECNGELVVENDIEYKLFYGMSSDVAMKKYDGEVKKYRSSEGKCVKIKHKGSVENTILDLLGGLRSALSYINCYTVDDITNVKFIRVNNQVNKIFN